MKLLTLFRRESAAETFILETEGTSSVHESTYPKRVDCVKSSVNSGGDAKPVNLFHGEGGDGETVDVAPLTLINVPQPCIIAICGVEDRKSSSNIVVCTRDSLCVKSAKSLYKYIQLIASS